MPLQMGALVKQEWAQLNLDVAISRVFRLARLAVLSQVTAIHLE